MANGWVMEDWIWKNLSPTKSNSAVLLYNRLESQSLFNLPGIYQPLSVEEKGHWYDITICSIFGASMGKAQKVLDIGPGDGWPILRTAHYFEKSVGIDSSEKRVLVQKENAKRLGITNVEFLVMDSVEMDFPANSFDGVMAASSIEQSQDPRKTLQEISRVLKKDGRLAIYFEDLEIYFPKRKGDERVFCQVEHEKPVLFYSCREKDPPREAVYGLFLSSERLKKETALQDELAKMGSTPWQEFDSKSISQDFFPRLADLVNSSSYYVLEHLSPEILEEELVELGFINLSSVDPFLSDVMDFFQLAQEKGYLSSFGPDFVKICELLGFLKVKEAREGCGTFTIATKGT